MMSVLAKALLTTALAATAFAQSPEDAPPWWRVQDDQTVSLFWSFDPPFPQGTFPPPSSFVVPPWYSASVTSGQPTPNLQWLPTLAGHIGVLGLPGNGSLQLASLDLTVDNDPQPDWIKMFYVQFDAFTAAGDEITVEIEANANYKRGSVTQDSEAIGNGWRRYTVKAQLFPQPDDEGVDWNFRSAGGPIGIDNLAVNSKCVKPGPDETGDALGLPTSVLGAATTPLSTRDCRGAAVTEGPAPLFERTYWVSATASAAGLPHELLQFSGNPIVVTPRALGANLTTVPQGPGDLAVETRRLPGGGVQQFVWVVLDQRPSSLPVVLQGVATTGGLPITIPLTFPSVAVVNPNQTLGLAFDPTGELGAGTFWISSTDVGGQGAMREFSRTTGALLDTKPLPAGVTGLGYDEMLGNFYGFRADPLPTPSSPAPIRAHGFELSGYDFQPTGVRFCGNLNVPTVGSTAPRGGIAAGFEVWRSRQYPSPTPAQLNMICLVDTPNATAGEQQLYQLAGPYSFGRSLLGRCGMADTGPFRGIPFAGAVFEPTLEGVPNALFAALLLGFSNTQSTLGPLPINLQPLLGWPESTLSVAPDVIGPLLVPSSPGRFSMPIQIPPTIAGYASIFVQWAALDVSVPGAFATTQAGKTVVYP
jgi:hypothetical protein